MSLEHILLGYLQKPATGYDLGREFADGAAHFWHAERSQIYPALKKLQRHGWLECREEPSERGPARKVYEITEAGRAELRDWLAAGPHIGRERLGYIAQTFFLDALGDLDETTRIVEAMRARWRATLAVLDAGRAEVMAATGGAEPEDLELFHRYAALRMGLHQLRAKLAWCDETLAILDRRTARASSDTPEV